VPIKTGAMGIPFRKRLGLVDRNAETRTDRGVMARTLMYPYAVGGTIALAAASGDPVRLGAIAAVCWIVALLLLAAYDAMPGWSFPVLTALGAGLLLWAVESHAGAAYACAPLLALPATYAMFFLRKVAALSITALASCGYVVAALAGPGLPWTQVAVAAVGIAAAAALVGLQRASANRLIWRLSDAAVTDALTGLMNRRGFQELIETELERARRSGQPLSLIIGDLDHFKALNDRFGHGAGDRALEQLALILDTAKRRIDTAARIGGEEFAVVLPDSDHHAAYILAERMRREVRETFMYEPYELTISLGVATFPLHGSSVEALVAQADEALYAAKALGRDRTMLYSDDLDDSVPPEAVTETHTRADRHSSTVLALADVVDTRDSRTVAHSQAVGRYAAAIARELGLPEPIVERVRFSGIVRDVGKIGIPDSILQKPGWLSAEDWNEMRRHPEIGASILAGADMDDVSEWVLSHHERPDGTGYPQGLSGAEIPFEARILAVADAYEAMTTDRIYRPAMTEDDARDELVRCAGTQFDKHVVDAFLRVLDSSSSPLRLRLVR
jgi:two-component system cell cycle response regulator